MPVDNTILGRSPMWLRKICASVDSLEDAGPDDLKQYNCYMLRLMHFPGGTFTGCVILSEPYPMTTEEWVKTVMPSRDYHGSRYGNIIWIKKVNK